MGPGQAHAVQAEYDRRSPEWDVAYDGSRYHDHLLRERKRLALGFVDDLTAERGWALDVGCGAGQLLDALTSRGWTALGCDISFRQALAARCRLDRSAVAQAHGGHLPVPERRADLVTALGYLEYQTDPARAMAELVRVARPGGTVVVSAPNRLRLNYLLDPPGVVRGRLFPQHRGYRRRYQTAATLGALLRHAGLIDVVVVGHGVGRFTIAGYPLGGEAAAVAIDRCLGRRLPSRAAARLGADLVACARVAG